MEKVRKMMKMKNILLVMSLFFASNVFSASTTLPEQLDRLYAAGMRTEFEVRKGQAYSPGSACYRTLGSYIAELRNLNAGYLPLPVVLCDQIVKFSTQNCTDHTEALNLLNRFFSQQSIYRPNQMRILQAVSVHFAMPVYGRKREREESASD